MLGHALAVGPEGTHAWASSLVHAHGRAVHVGVHGRPHAGRVHAAGRSPRAHELVVVGLRRAHLERGAHLEGGRGGRRCLEAGIEVRGRTVLELSSKEGNINN